jgi:ATP synthase protein I
VDTQETEDISQPLTKEQVSVLRQTDFELDLWHVVLWQALALLVLSVLLHVLTYNKLITASFVWGGLCALIPGSVFVLGVRKNKTASNYTGFALMILVKWELVKLSLTILMLSVSYKVINDISWLSLVIGFISTLKVYWLACYCLNRRGRLIGIKNRN